MTSIEPVVSAEGSSLPLSVLVDSHGESAVENNHPVVTPNPAPETETR